MRFALILSLLVSILAVIFAFQNPEPVDIEFLTLQSVPVPLALVVIVTLLIGVLVGTLFSVPNRFRARGRIKKLEKRIAELETTPDAPAVVEHKTVVKEAPDVVVYDERTVRDEGADETARIAAETQRMADEAQRRAAEAERRSDSDAL